MGQHMPIFPAPGSGITLDRLPKMVEFYGNHIILLIAGGLYGHSPDLGENCREFRQFMERVVTG